MTPWHAKYIRQFQANPGYNDAARYGVQILHSAAPVWGERYFAVIGVHHLSGEENHGQHHAFCEVLDEAGKRIEGARINILTDGRPRGSMVIDKGDNEPGTNTQMHFEDTLTLYLAGDIPGEKVTGLHTRHEDEEQGTTRGHHSFLVIWQLKRVGSGPPPVDPPEEEPEPTPATTYAIATRTIYTVEADGEQIAAAADLEAAQRIVAALVLLEASQKDHRAAAYVEGLRRLAEDE